MEVPAAMAATPLGLSTLRLVLAPRSFSARPRADSGWFPVH